MVLKEIQVTLFEFAAVQHAGLPVPEGSLENKQT